jgi:hypothetical protein
VHHKAHRCITTRAYASPLLFMARRARIARKTEAPRE